MKNNGVRFSYQLWAIIFLSVVAVVMWIINYYRVPIGDECIYEYVWEEDDPYIPYEPGHRYERKISNLEEVVQTQVIHYQKINGRALIHFIEQCFTGHKLLFSVCNTLLFLLFVALLISIISNGKAKGLKAFPLLVLILIGAYFLPERIWLFTSINLSPNYVLPSVLAMTLLIISDKIDAKNIDSKYNALIAFLALIFGWTHESFVVGIGGGLFFYYLFNKRVFNRQQLWIFIPMFLTGILLIFAPGNFIRYVSAENPNRIALLNYLFGWMKNLLELWILRFLIIGCLMLIICGKWQQLKGFIKTNSKLAWVFLIAFIFSMIANTGPRSNMVTELIGLILILRYIYGNTNILRHKYAYVASAILSVLISAYLIYFAKIFIADSEYKQKVLKEWNESWDGLVKYEGIKAENIFYWGNSLHNPPLESTGKPFLVMNSIDYQAVECPEKFFIPQNKIAGSAMAYSHEESPYVWLVPHSYDSTQRIEVEYYPVNLSDNIPLRFKLRPVLTPHEFSNKEIVKVDTIITRFGTSYRIGKNWMRRIKSVNVIDNPNI